VSESSNNERGEQTIEPRWSYDGLEPARGLPTDEFGHSDGFFEVTDDLIAPALYDDVARSQSDRESDDTRIYWQQWDHPSIQRRGVVVLMHGYGEHSSRFAHVAGAFARAGYTTVAMDARGHGRSTGRRGHVEKFSDYVLDYAEFMERTRRRLGRIPMVSLGHSNGGLIVLRYAACHPASSHIDAWAVTSPFCGFSGDVPATKAFAGKMLSRLWGTLSLPTDIDPADLSHVERVAETYSEDPLVFEEATARWFTETLQAQDDVADRATKIQGPFLFLLAGEDRIVDSSAARDVFHNLGSSDRELEVFPDLYHELLNETAWTEIADRIIQWFHRHREKAERSANGERS